jgi:hypothetical protein
MVDEHDDRPPHAARDLKHLFENVAIRIFEIDENDVGIDAGNLS